MKKALILTVSLWLSCLIAFSQELPYQRQIVNKKLSELPDSGKNDSPLAAYTTFFNASAYGRNSLFRELSSDRLKPYFSKTETDKPVTEKHRQEILNTLIREVLIYRDSVAAVVTDFSKNNEAYAWFLYEDGKWLNAGQGLRSLSVDKDNYFTSNAAVHLSSLQRIYELKQLPADTMAFMNYITTKGLSPKEYLLKTLSERKLVISGDLHRRRVAWDFLRSVALDPRFAKIVGTVFIELPSHRQPDLDRFYSKSELDTGILLDIFRDEQIYGWYDKGEFEFMTELWKINKRLPEDKKIKVVLADFQAPFSSITTREEYDEYGMNGKKRKNRDAHMADVIESHLKSSSDPRNSLFVVGYAHSFMTAETVWHDRQPSAGYVLSERLGRENVFSILPHVPVITNSGQIWGRMRHGFYDYLFAQNGNRPVGFDIGGSPFADQPFDGISTTMYRKSTGSFADNYDGYIFLQPLEAEENEYQLYEVFSDEFVEEIKRRAAISGDLETVWYGSKVKDMTRESVITYLKTKYDVNKKRWADSLAE